jgi:hypothetical protein
MSGRTILYHAWEQQVSWLTKTGSLFIMMAGNQSDKKPSPVQHPWRQTGTA